MNRGRRLASILVVASLGLGSLVGCQTETGKAAFVGDTTISEDRVSQVFDDVVAKASTEEPAPEASGSPAPPAQPPVTRQRVLDVLLSLELARRLVKEKNMPPAADPIDPAAVGEALKVPGDSEYAKLCAEWYGLQSVIIQNTPPVRLTDAGVTKVYDALVKANLIQPGAQAEQVREQIAQTPSAAEGTLVATSLGAMVEKTDTKVNPRYEPVNAPVYLRTEQGLLFYDLPFISSDLVTDVSAL
jgi:hypothetical protein